MKVNVSIQGNQPVTSLSFIASLNDLLAENRVNDIVIDSRHVVPGSIFLALPGKRTDGHNFVKEAVERGATGLIINEKKRDCVQELTPRQQEKTRVIPVEDTLKALVSLARQWRQRFTYPVIGITGSIGKTTTKEMVRSILQVAAFPAFVSYKNQNTLIGLSLNILKMNDNHPAAIFELGVNEPGEMKTLTDVLRPTAALITEVSHSHTQYLGSLTHIAQEKRAIFSHFAPDNIGIVNGDQELLSQAYYHHPIIKFGLKMRNQMQARKIRVQSDDDTLVTTFNLIMYNEKRAVKLPGNHRGRITNALAACSVAHLLGISIDDCVQGLELFSSVEGRFTYKKLTHNRGVLIDDCYNANPESMRAALLALHEMKNSSVKIAVLGDMLELGEKEEFWHRQIGRVLCRAMSIGYIILVGKRAQLIAKTAPLTIKTLCVATAGQAIDALNTLLQPKDSLVLIKASNGMQLCKLVKAFIRSEKTA